MSNPIVRLMRRQRSDLDYALMEGSLGTVMTTVTSGVYLTGFALALGANDVTIGLLASLPSLAALFQFIGSYLIEQIGSSKKLCLAATLAHRLTWVVMIVIPFVFAPRYRLAVVVGAVGLMSIFAAMTSVSWMSWSARFIPSSSRGRFLGRRSMIAGVVGMVFALLAGRFIDFWRRTHPERLLHGYSILYLLGLTFGLVGWWALSRISSNPESGQRPSGFWFQIRQPLKNDRFRRLLLYGSAWTFSVRIVAPFFDVYMIRELSIPFSMIASFALVSGLLNIVGTRLSGGAADEVGAKLVLVYGSVGACVSPLLWMLTTPENYLILWLVNAMTGISWAAIGLSTSILLLKMVPSEGGAIYFATFAAVTGLAGAIAPSVGGLLSGLIRDTGFTLFTPALSGLRIMFLLSAVLRMASLFPLLQVNVPDEAEVTLDSIQDLRLVYATRTAMAYSIGTVENLNLAMTTGVTEVEARLEEVMARGAAVVRSLVRGSRTVGERVDGWLESVETVLDHWIGILFDHLGVDDMEDK